MAAYTYPSGVVLIESTGLLAIGAVGVLRPTNGGTSVQVYDLNGSPIPGVVVGSKGVHQPFQADISYGVLDFGSVLLPAESMEFRSAGTTALAAAQDALTQAQDAVAAADQALASALSSAALAARFVPFWAPGEAVSAGDIRVTRTTGETIRRNAGGTTGTSYNSTEAALWTVVASGSGGGTFTPDISNAVPWSVHAVVQNADGTWPNRITTRTDIIIAWVRLVAGSSDPAAATAPAVNGMYPADFVYGA